MARFEVREIFRLTSRAQIVVAGNVLDGTVKSGSVASFELQPGLVLSAKVASVEYLDRVGIGQSLVCPLLPDRDATEAEIYAEICPPGTIINVDDPTTAAHAGV